MALNVQSDFRLRFSIEYIIYIYYINLTIYIITSTTYTLGNICGHVKHISVRCKKVAKMEMAIYDNSRELAPGYRKGKL